MVVVLIFQLVIIGQPLPDAATIVGGMVMVVLGLTFFIQGLEMGLFPIGESMAHAFARKGSLIALIAFAFCLGFGTTIAEPALIAVAEEAGKAAVGSGFVVNHEGSQGQYSMGLRIAVALSVGVAIVLGVIRIIKGWALHKMIMVGYGLVIVMTYFAPKEIIGIAYDSGGVTTSTITVPLITALGVGLAHSIKGRNPMLDGFGLVAFASLTPIIFVMIYGLTVNLWLT